MTIVGLEMLHSGLAAVVVEESRSVGSHLVAVHPEDSPESHPDNHLGIHSCSSGTKRQKRAQPAEVSGLLGALRRLGTVAKEVS